MNRILVFALFLIVGFAGAWWLTSRGEAPLGDPPPGVAPAVGGDANSPDAMRRAGADAGTETGGGPKPAAGPTTTRTDVTEPGAQTELPQGLLGRIVDPLGNPIQGATIDLMEGIARNPFDVLVIAERGVVVPPTARATSGPDGRFAVGAQSVSPHGYTLRARAANFAETTLAEVTMFAGRFSDLGDVRLERGVALTGRVTVQGSEGFPVPGATITARPVGLTPLAAPTADREDGVTVACDATGTFRFDSLPVGMIQLVAVAPDFARVVRPAVDLRMGTENTCNFELPRGAVIRGFVRDATGRPLAGARLDARAIVAANLGLTIARADANGRFELIGLIEGAYVVGATATGHVRAELKPVRAGDHDVEISLETQPQLDVLVETPSGKALEQYDLLLLRFRAENEGLTGVPGAQIARVLPVDLIAGRFAYGGVDPGTYVMQVEAEGFAKSFSAPFAVELPADRVEVRIVALRGARLTLRVLSPEGAPLAGASVETLPAFVDDNPMLRMLGEVVPTRTTRTVADTGADGRVDIQTLAFGNYRLRIAHPEYCDLWRSDLDLRDESALDLGDLRLAQGAAVSGIATLDGRPAGQIRVSLVSIETDAPSAVPQVLADAVTDDTGEFRLSKRLPSGRYVARARRETLPTILLQVLDYQKTRQDVTIGPGQETVRLRFALQSN